MFSTLAIQYNYHLLIQLSTNIVHRYEKGVPLDNISQSHKNSHLMKMIINLILHLVQAIPKCPGLQTP